MSEQPLADQSSQARETQTLSVRRAYEAPRAEFVPLQVTERLMSGCGMLTLITSPCMSNQFFS